MNDNKCWNRNESLVMVKGNRTGSNYTMFKDKPAIQVCLYWYVLH